MVMDVALILSAFNPIGGEGTGEEENITILIYRNVKSTDHLYVDEIGRNHLDVGTTSKFRVLISCKNIHCLTEPSKQVKQCVGR